MTGTLIVWLLLGAPPSEAAEPATTSPGEAAASTADSAKEESVEEPTRTPLTGIALRDAAREAMRRWARPEDEEAEQAAIALLHLYSDLEKDDDLANSQREYLKTKLRVRLLALGEQIAKRVARDKRLAERNKVTRPASVKLPDGKGEPLAQGVGVANFTTGFGQSGFGRNNGVGDNGPALVELIQRTIAPTSWDVNGGPGSIYYWQPGHALVIRQMDSVHEDIDGLLRQLERANR